MRKEAVIKLIRKNKRVSVTQIAKELNVTRRTIFRITDALKSENRIKRVGDLKSGTWEVIE
ncbi:MAG: HTH domain-containing protein [Muribaculaceae bacterium]|nr:HTH domain-containing protein [Muribaculaceae bacterium]MDE6866078.1 HTH domain-containing protein [Muribaculaceae bacterium]